MPDQIKRIEVAVGVVQKGHKVLVGQRLVQDRYFQKWEFPGGKLDNNENAIQALKRELNEELGIEVVNARPLITLEHDYPDRHVRLHVFLVTSFLGDPHGVEGQSVKWVEPDECKKLDFLEANTPLINAVKLPSLIAITDIRTYGLEKTLEVIGELDRRYVSDFALQIREFEKSDEELEAYLNKIRQVTDSQFIFLNGAQKQALDLGFDGVQLNRHKLRELNQRSNDLKKIPSDFWVGASCHGIEEIRLAENIADFALLSPVKNTESHPKIQGMGWSQFNQITNKAKLPCYGLGGLNENDIETSFTHGSQGISAISSIWEVA